MLLIVGSSFKLVFDTYTDTLGVDNPIVKFSYIKSFIDNLLWKDRSCILSLLYDWNVVKDFNIWFYDGWKFLPLRILESNGLLHCHNWSHWLFAIRCRHSLLESPATLAYSSSTQIPFSQFFYENSNRSSDGIYPIHPECGRRHRYCFPDVRHPRS